MYIRDAAFGIEPKVREYLGLITDALNGDMVLNAKAPALSAAAINAAIGGDDEKYTFPTRVTLENAAGEDHLWWQGSFAVAATKTSTGGVVAIKGGATSVDLPDGEGVVELELTGTWISGDTVTLTVTGKTILGKSVSNKVLALTLGA